MALLSRPASTSLRPLSTRGAARVAARRNVSIRATGGDEPNVYEQIKASRAAKKAAREAAAAEQAAAAEATLAAKREGSEDALDAQLTEVVARDGWMVKVEYDVYDGVTGELEHTSRRVQPVSFQMGTDAGFAPKKGIFLAFNKALEFKGIGDTAEVEVRAGGSFIFKTVEAWVDGAFCCVLSKDDKVSPWFQKNARVVVEIISLTPPRGRSLDYRGKQI